LRALPTDWIDLPDPADLADEPAGMRGRSRPRGWPGEGLCVRRDPDGIVIERLAAAISRGSPRWAKVRRFAAAIDAARRADRTSTSAARCTHRSPTARSLRYTFD
jgi:hypothetical protein